MASRGRATTMRPVGSRARRVAASRRREGSSRAASPLVRPSRNTATLRPVSTWPLADPRRSSPSSTRASPSGSAAAPTARGESLGEAWRKRGTKVEWTWTFRRRRAPRRSSARSSPRPSTRATSTRWPTCTIACEPPRPAATSSSARPRRLLPGCRREPVPSLVVRQRRPSGRRDDAAAGSLAKCPCARRCSTFSPCLSGQPARGSSTTSCERAGAFHSTHAVWPACVVTRRRLGHRPQRVPRTWSRPSAPAG